jgi:pimeloyl-ACP methyl ester carboxylesterase
MSTIFRDGAAIEYQVRGQGDITLLFVHGSYLDQECWKSQVEHFERDFRVVTLDLPGHGRSGKGREHWSMAGFAEDVSAVIRETGPGPLILIGHSMGADVNLMAAASHPGSAIGFIAVENFKNAATPLPPENQAQVEPILGGLRSDFPGTSETYARMVLLTPDTPRPIADQVVDAYRNAYPPMGLAIVPEIFGIDRVEREFLPRLALKLHLINVDYFPTNEEPLRRYLPKGYSLTHLGGTCHFPMLENPGALNAALEGSIAGILKDAAVPA